MVDGGMADEIVAVLLAPSNRTRVASFPRPVDRVDVPGLYAWFVDGAGAAELTSGLGVSIHEGLIYAGQAGSGLSRATLRSRVRGNHIGGNITASTFRQTLAAILAESLMVRREAGRALEGDGEAVLSRWMLEHLEVAVAPIEDRTRLAILEALVLHEINPPLNLQGMTPSPVRTAVSRLRRSFGKAANTRPRPVTEPLAEPHAAPHPASLDGAPDVGVFLLRLVGQTIPTLSGRRNRILAVEHGWAVIGTSRSPQGRAVEIAQIQKAAGRLFTTGELRVDVSTLGYRSAFFGAVLAALPGTRVLEKPRRVVVVDQKWPPNPDEA